jgi:CRISPR type III-A-associated protein Csm2
MNKMKELLKDISFKKEDKKLADMFGEKAGEIAKDLNVYKQKGKIIVGITTTQYRKFYDEVLKLNEKANGVDFDMEILPFVKMLVSKVQYSNTRGLCGANYVELMKMSISKVDSKEELQNFKLFLEAIVGFMPKN